MTHSTGQELVRERVTETLSPLTAQREHFKSVEPGVAGDLESALDQVASRVEVIARENEGMACDLLRCYEQLSVVSDVTRYMLILRTELEVMEFFAMRLRDTYPDCLVGVAWPEEGNYAVKEGFPALPKWLTASIRDCRERRRVLAANSGESAGIAPDGASLYHQEAVTAPVFAGPVFVCALVLWRRSETESVSSWDSGDVQLFDSLCSFCGDAMRNFRLVQELQEVAMETVRTLVNAVDQKDPYTSGHSNRVGYYAKLLATELGLEADALRALQWSALMHDIGKIGIRDDVLKKAGKLTEEEFDHIKEHPQRGHAIVRENPHMQASLDGVLHHHERYDGKGYPSGLAGEQIPLQARIIQTADIFDALTTNRSYRGAFSWQEALKILEEESGTVVDPLLCSIFASMMRRYYEQNPTAFDAIGNPGDQPNLCEDSEPTQP